MSNRESWNVITLFCVMIFGITAATMLKPQTSYSEMENRTLAQKPAVTLSSVLSGQFEKDYEDYLTDQFIERNAWIGFKTGVERILLKKESKEIYFAADDYLIETHAGTFTTENASLNIRVLQNFAGQYLERFGRDHMTFMVIPNAVDILREKLPSYAAPYDEEVYLEQIRSVLPGGTWFDASEVLKEHAEEELYYRTDHHWKTKAAFYVYQVWADEKGYEVPSESDYTVEEVTDSFQGTIQSKLGAQTRTDSIEIYHPKQDIFYSFVRNDETERQYNLYFYNALDTKSKYDLFFGGNHAKVSISTKAGTGRKLLMIKDSYAHCFVPFLFKEFDRIDMLDIRYYNQKLSELIEENGYTDLLFLYNAAGFAEDTAISRITY